VVHRRENCFYGHIDLTVRTRDTQVQLRRTQHVAQGHEHRLRFEENTSRESWNASHLRARENALAVNVTLPGRPAKSHQKFFAGLPAECRFRSAWLCRCTRLTEHNPRPGSPLARRASRRTGLASGRGPGGRWDSVDLQLPACPLGVPKRKWDGYLWVGPWPDRHPYSPGRTFLPHSFHVLALSNSGEATCVEAIVFQGLLVHLQR